MRKIAAGVGMMLVSALAVPAMASPVDGSAFFENFDGPSAAVMPYVGGYTTGQLLQTVGPWMGGNATATQISASNAYTGPANGIAMRIQSRATSATARGDTVQWSKYVTPPGPAVYGATTSATNIFRIDIDILQNATLASGVFWSSVPKYSTNVNPLGGISGYVGWRGGASGGSGFVQTRAQTNVAGTPGLGVGATAAYYNGGSEGASYALTNGAWNTVSIIVDYGSAADPAAPYPDYVGQVAYLINGVVKEVDTGVHFSGGPAENSIGAMDFNNETYGPGNGSAVYLDNLSVHAIATFVPEPATLTLFGLGAFALLRRRR